MPIPNWILRQMTLPYGARLPKAPAATTYRWSPGMGGYSYTSGSGGYVQGAPIINGKVNVGNLQHQEYEWFGGNSWPDSGFCSCRYCLQTFHNTELRRQHIKDTDCSQRIKKVCALLRRDRKCVVCDQRTSRKPMWGVYLCRTECIALFKFKTHKQHDAYEAAKVLVKAL